MITNFVWDTINETVTPNYAATTAPATLDSETAMWYLQEKGNPANSWSSYAVINNKYEHYIADLGISLTINQAALPGNGTTDASKSGYIGDNVEYLNANAEAWMVDGGLMRVFHLSMKCYKLVMLKMIKNMILKVHLLLLSVTFHLFLIISRL